MKFVHAEIRIPRPESDWPICGTIQFKIDDGSSSTILGAKAVRSVLKIGIDDTVPAGEAQAFDGRKVKMRSLTAFLRLVHKPALGFVSRFKVSVFKLDLMIQEDLFAQPENTRFTEDTSPRSLLGQDVIHVWREIGQRKEPRRRSGWVPDFEWVMYDLKPNQKDSWFSGESVIGKEFPFEPYPTHRPDLKYPAIGRRSDYFRGSTLTYFSEV